MFDQHIAAQQTVVKHQVNKEVVVVKGKAFLARLKQKPLAQLQQEVFDLVDDLPLSLARSGASVPVGVAPSPRMPPNSLAGENLRGEAPLQRMQSGPAAGARSGASVPVGVAPSPRMPPPMPETLPSPALLAVYLVRWQAH